MRTTLPRPTHRRAWRTAVAAAALIAGSCVPIALQSTAHATETTGGGNGGDVIANLFEWNWPSVAAECTDVLGPKGYGAVQVAPPEDSIRIPGATHDWWDVYQPVGYDLNSRMGDAAQFQAMVTTCHNAGVKVYADAVINHMSGTNQTSTDSYGGDSFNVSGPSYNEVPYTSADFHTSPANCPNSDMSIQDWNSQTQVQECDLEGLADLYTETDDVRAKIAGYLNSLIADGVDGFRIDSAKHINQADMANIESRLNNTLWGQRPYVLQEVALGGTGNLAPAAFEGNGSVIGFDYADALKAQFQGDIANLKTFGQSWGLEPSDKDGAMVANHDTERDGSTLNYQDGSQYTLATEFMLAWGYGVQPTVYSGFSFSDPNASPPSDANGFVTDTDCSSSAWVCTDRVTGIANMVGWHNAAQGQPVANWWDNGGNAIAFSRGSSSWIAINNSGSAVTETFTTGLPEGSYCDIIHGDPGASGSCTGPAVSVNGSGQATVTVPADDSVAVYTGAPSGGGSATPTPSASASASATATPSGGTVAETFTVAGAPSGESVYLTGSISALGDWDTATAIPMTQSGSTWTATVDLPSGTAFQYKYLEKDGSGNVTWEPGGNQSADSGSAAGAVSDTWGSPGTTPTASPSSGPGQVSVTFDEDETTVPGQNVYLVGSIPALGDWATGSALPLSSQNYPDWSVTVSLPADTAFQYKFIVKDGSGNVTWEDGANRGYTTGASGSATLSDTWQ
ncbi:alpha-amylase [Streptacidiphilus sp. P02-A3a]|nr:carbohydrate-binding module family 20 domain-containing protein [Streptacidiphilus sp. P02-A3a]QMU69512.1 alpha-amylase [Streptacidiphilus sp. P02-A3a]